eukprot:Mycagemm_TRINITY_DN10189_c0_g1::TRINITY_DN10189_c0_g1_i1::g.5111::m.5111 type:complete len:114 gc:universal TRINITY_DN10189_c0_g1_i1:679-338(-)
MTEALQLINAIARLHVRIVARADRSHASRLIARVRLGGVLKIRVRTARTIYADVACHGDVRATMRLAHHGNHCNARSSTDWLRLELRDQNLAERVRDGGDDVHCLWRLCELVL